MNRTPLKRKTQLRSHGKLKTVGRRGKREASELQAWRKEVWARSYGHCVWCSMKREVMHAHHILGRQSHPHLKYYVPNGVLLCGLCHAWAHHDVDEAREQFLARLNPTEFARMK